MYCSSRGGNGPCRWQFNNEIFPHLRSFTVDQVEQKLEEANKRCRDYILIALPPLFSKDCFHLIHVIKYQGGLYIKYIGCYSGSYEDEYNIIEGKKEAIDYSNELKNDFSSYSNSRLTRVLFTDASGRTTRRASIVWNTNIEVKTVQEWENIISYTTIDPLESEELHAHITTS